MINKTTVLEKLNLTPTQMSNVCDSLANWFSREQPPANKVEAIADSLKWVDPKARLIKALVKTAVVINKTTKIHFSQVRVKLDASYRIIPNSMYFV